MTETDIKSGIVPGAFVVVRAGMVIKDDEDGDLSVILKIEIGKDHEDDERLEFWHCDNALIMGPFDDFTLVHTPFQENDWVIDTVTGVEARVCRSGEPDWIDIAVSEDLPAQRIAISPEIVHKIEAMRDAPEWNNGN